MTLKRPFFSILTPVFNPPSDAFDKCVESVLGQTFVDWEWCLVDDAADQSTFIDKLKELEARDPRIRLKRRQTNGGIVAASNDAAAIAEGQFLCLLDHDDMLDPEALSEVRSAVRADDLIDYIYTDEDKIDSNGNCYDTFLKPAWSPERLGGEH